MKRLASKIKIGLMLCAALTWILAATAPALAASVRVAVAANFHNPLKAIAAAFEKETRHTISIIPGSTGKLYAQIVNGAPYDLFLAADDKRPALLEKESKAAPNTRFTYALGRITLWSPDPGTDITDAKAALLGKNVKRIAIANPKTAPYGHAALQTLTKLGLLEPLKARLILGENIGQTFQFVSSKNAQLGFIALSQVLDPANKIPGSRWDVPDDFHDPLRQDAVLLKRAQANPAARDLLQFLQSGKARSIMEQLGYRLP